MTTNMLLDAMANCSTAELLDWASERPTGGRALWHILEYLCSREPEEMQRLLDERLSETWHAECEEIF